MVTSSDIKTVQAPYFFGMALTVFLGPCGLFFLYRKGLATFYLIPIFFIFWLGFYVVLFLAASSSFQLYSYLVINALFCLYIFGVMPPRFLQHSRVAGKVIMQVFSSFALLFGLSVVLPLYDFFILEEQKMYLVNNKNIELIYTYSLASYGCFLGVFFWLLNVYLYANNSFLEYSGAKK